MNKQLTGKLFDPNTVAAVEFLAAEDANTVLAVWYRMLILAIHDPEGCVRLTPGLSMDAAELAAYFHCTTEAMEATIQIMEQLQHLTRNENGGLQVTACTTPNRRGKNKNTAAAALFSGEKETEKEKRKEAKEKSKEKNKKGDIAAAISDSARALAPGEPDPGKQDKTAAAADGIQHSTQDNNEPFRPYKTKNRLIPLADLPEPARNILNAWNELPLDNKFEGMYPSLLKQMQTMLEHYGEEALLKAVANVADSSFLLGQSHNNRGWAISLGWMLKPDHVENILQGKYRDKTPRGKSETFLPGEEPDPYSNGFYGTVVD